jgi:hypothetical protein
MSYRAKYTIALVLFIIGSLVVLSGYLELSGSFGVREIITSGAWKLGIGVAIVAVAAPLFSYYRARKSQRLRSEDIEIAVLAKKGEQHLRDQDKEE